MALITPEEVLIGVRIFSLIKLDEILVRYFILTSKIAFITMLPTPTPHITYKKLSPQSSNMMNLQENSTVVASNSPLSRVNPTTHWETVSEVQNWLRLYQWNYLFLRFNFKQSTVRGVTIHYQHCNSIYWPNFWNRSIFWRGGLENNCQRKALSSTSSR